MENAGSIASESANKRGKLTAASALRINIAVVTRRTFRRREESAGRERAAVGVSGGGCPTGAPRLAADRADTDGHADRFWALALAASAAATGAVEFGYTPAPRRRSAQVEEGPGGTRGWLRPDHSDDHAHGGGRWDNGRGAW